MSGEADLLASPGVGNECGAPVSLARSVGNSSGRQMPVGSLVWPAITRSKLLEQRRSYTGSEEDTNLNSTHEKPSPTSPRVQYRADDPSLALVRIRELG